MSLYGTNRFTLEPGGTARHFDHPNTSVHHTFGQTTCSPTSVPKDQYIYNFQTFQGHKDSVCDIAVPS